MTRAKGTAYYVGAWNGNFDDKLHVLADVSPLPTGSPVVIGPKPEACDWNVPWTCQTHSHSFTDNVNFGCGPNRVETDGRDWIDCTVVHVAEGTLASGDQSLATVISHEVGHHLYLDDHFSPAGADTIMNSPSPGIMQPTWADKATAGACRYISYC